MQADLSTLEALLKRVETGTVRPILFSGPMVRALLDGRKTQTRRMLKPQPPTTEAVRTLSGSDYHWMAPTRAVPKWCVAGPVWAVRQFMGCEPTLKVPFAVGDVLWVRESCYIEPGTTAETWDKELDDVVYRADGGSLSNGPDDWAAWKPSIHMPRWASRLTLQVTGVKVERLQDISEADAIAEGATSKPCPQQWAENAIGWSMDWPEVEPKEGWRYVCLHTARFAFANLWNRINGENAWAFNPWVVAVTFTVHQQNVDAYLHALLSEGAKGNEDQKR